MKFKTADLCDEFNETNEIQVLSPEFKSFGGLKKFRGKIVTIKLNKSNWRLLEMLRDEKGEGRVVVVDVDRAFYGVIGDKLTAFALKNNWTAMILNGYVRDTDQTTKMDVGLIALGTCPLRNFDKTESSRGETLNFGGVTFNDGDYIYADRDGVIITKEKLISK